MKQMEAATSPDWAAGTQVWVKVNAIRLDAIALCMKYQQFMI